MVIIIMISIIDITIINDMAASLLFKNVINTDRNNYHCRIAKKLMNGE